MAQSNDLCTDLNMVEVGPFMDVVELNDYLINGNRIVLPNSEIDTKVYPYNGIIHPISPTGPPKTDNFPGLYNFHLEINGVHTQRNKYMYSHKLHRIYVDMKQNFSVNFNWNTSHLQQQPMYVRATVTFSDATQAEKRVESCSQHFYEQCSSPGAENMTEAEKKNVLRSARASGSPDVFYCGTPSQVNSWYSVVVLFPAPSSHAYTFICKSSCSSGINRRAINIIFTLEDAEGRVYGQDSVGVRVCSCPRRDLKRDEKDVPRAGKRKLSTPDTAATPPSSPSLPDCASDAKTLRIEPARRDNELVQLPQMVVVGHSAAVTGLTVMRNMMAQARDHRLASRQPVEDLDRAINNIQGQIERLENTTPSDH